MKVNKLKLKKPLSKKEKNKLFFTIFKLSCLILIMLAMIIGSSFAASNNQYNLSLGIAYNGGYILDVQVKNSIDPTGKVDLDKSLFDLKNKLDPLGTQDTYISTVQQKGGASFDSLNHLKVVTSKVNKLSAIQESINRLGAVYFLDNNGKDLLASSAAASKNDDAGSRTPLNQVISSVSVGNDKQQHVPTITFNVADANAWNKVTSALSQSKSSLYVWMDLADFMNEIRSNPNAAYAVAQDLQGANSSDANVSKFFDYTYSLNGSTIHGNFLIDGMISMPTNYKNRLADQGFKWTTPIEKFEINPNDKNVDDNIYIKSVRSKLYNMYIDLLKSTDSKIINHFKNYLINAPEIFIANQQNKPFTGTVVKTETITDANLIKSLITPSLEGIQYVTTNYANLPPSINKTLLLSATIVLGIIALILAIYLLIYYRLFGVIAILTLATTIILTLYFSSLLNVSVSPQSIATLITLFIVGYESVILFFSRYKHERYTNLLPFASAIKIANRQTITIIFNILVILAIVGLSFFWEGTSNLKAFGNIFLIGILLLFVFVFVVGQISYWLIIKLKLQEKFPWLDFPNWSLLQFINDKRSQKNKKPLFSSFTRLTKFSAWSATDILKSNDDNVNNNDNPDNLIGLGPIGKKNKVDKPVWWKRVLASCNLKNVRIWSPIVIFSIVLIAILVGISGGANIDNSIQKGTDFKIVSTSWVQLDKEKIVNVMNDAKKEKSEYSRINFNVYEFHSLTENNGEYFLIETNISTNRVSLDMQLYLANKLNLPDSIIVSTVKPVMEIAILKLAIICLAISLAFILLYSIFVLDWVQFLAIFASSIFALGLTIALTVIFHILFNFELIIAFVLVFILALAFATILMSKIKQNKKVIKEEAYNTFVNYILENHNQLKRIRNEPKIFYKTEYQRLITENPNLTRRDLHKQFAAEIKKLKLQTKEYKKENKTKIEEIKYEFKKYDKEHNLIKKISNITILQLVNHIFMLIVIGTILLFPFAFLSSNLVGIGIVIFIGIFVGIYTSITVGVKVWTFVERYRTINKVRVKNYLDSQRIDIDEQKVSGVNS